MIPTRTRLARRPPSSRTAPMAMRAALAAVLLLASAPAGAQSCTTPNATGTACATPITLNMSMPVADVMRLTLSGTTTALGAPDGAAYTAGYRDAAGPTVTVKANRAYRVQVLGATANFTYTGSLTNPNKPRTDLMWGTVAGAYPNGAGAAATLLSGLAAPAPSVSAPSQQIFLRTLWTYAAGVPGTYSLVLNFTLAAP
jgi:opacity protein-like surface antigen